MSIVDAHASQTQDRERTRARWTRLTDPRTHGAALVHEIQAAARGRLSRGEEGAHGRRSRRGDRRSGHGRLDASRASHDGRRIGHDGRRSGRRVDRHGDLLA